MKRLSLSLVLAVVAAACGGSNSTTPTPVPTGAPRTWVGPVRMITHITGVTELAIVAEGEVVWSEDKDPELDALGGVLYTPSSGVLTVTYDQWGGGCREHGVGSLSFAGKGGAFVLQPSGSYGGNVTWRETPPFPTVVTCGPVTATRPAEVVFLEGFPMSGVRADGRIKGEWTKVEGDATYGASWDLTPR